MEKIKIWNWLKSAVVAYFFSNEYVQKKYVRAGAIFGDATSYIYLGECAETEELLNRWSFWEREYARRGYRTISLDVFIDYGGWGKPLENLGAKRSDDEKPVFHAEIYRKRFLGKIKPQIDLAAVMKGEVRTGEYVLPSTEE